MQWLPGTLGANAGRDKADMEQGAAEPAEPATNTKLQDLSKTVTDVTDQMKENVNKIIYNLEKGDDLRRRAEEMESEAAKLADNGNRVARTYWWKNVKVIVLIVVVALIIVLLIVLLAIGVIPASAPVPAIISTTSKP